MTNLMYRPNFLGFDVLSDFFNGVPYDFDSALAKTTQGYPITDIYRGESGETVIELALAGFKREDLRIEVHPDKRSITVSAAGTAGQTGSQKRIARRSFSKTYVNYDNNLNLTAATAKFENGLLTVTVPKLVEAKAVSIDIT